MDIDDDPQSVCIKINKYEASAIFYYKNKRISTLQFSEICRICLSKSNISSMYNNIYEDKSAFDILTLHAIIEINPDDDMPQHICGNCKSTLFQLYSFVLKCKRSNNLLCNVQKSNSIHEVLDNKLNVIPKSVPFVLKCKRSNSLVCDVPKSDLTREALDNKLIVIPKSIPGTIMHKAKSFEEQKSNLVETRFPPEMSTAAMKDHNSTLVMQGTTSKGREISYRQCTVCLRSFKSSKLRQHMRAHTKEKPFKCRICFQGFSISGNLKRHMMTHTGERPHVCEICGKGFIQATTLHNHKKTHTKYELISGDASCPSFLCTHCGRGFKRLARYEAHLKKHLGENNIEKTGKCEGGNARHKCATCNKSYKTKHLLKAHELTHGEKTFLCNECGKGFVTKAALESHLKVHSGEKPHSCKVCHKRFAHVGSFEAHMLIHTGQRPYNCNICGRTFTQLSHLKYHMRTHSGERPYNCNYCGKSFALKGNLTVHIRTHTGETPYVCPVCCKGFYDSSSMKKHQKGHIKRAELSSICVKTNTTNNTIINE